MSDHGDISELIEALKVFQKYDPPAYSTGCEHDVLYVWVDPYVVSEEDKRRLEEFGFFPDADGGVFRSYRWG